MSDDERKKGTALRDAVRDELGEKTTFVWSDEAIDEVIDGIKTQIDSIVEATDQEFMEDSFIRSERNKPPREGPDDRDVRKAKDDINYSALLDNSQTKQGNESTDRDLDDNQVDESCENTEYAEDGDSDSDYDDS